MNTIFFITLILVCLHFNLRLYITTLLSLAFFLLIKCYFFAGAAFVFFVLFCIPLVRRYLLSKPILMFIKTLGVLPKISETEKTAIDAGTTWIEGEFFKVKPDIKKILNEPFEMLNEEEKQYLANEVEEICNSTTDWEIFENKDLPKHVWEKLKEKRVFGMIISKQYGGLDFSAPAQSAIVGKLASVSQVLAITTMVPNSLGPGELLLKYGTDKQKNYYLPRLANGTDIPCFGLTEPTAGSDAGSIKSNGILFKDATGRLKIRLNFEKRYITLGGIATVIGLAFKLEDPENLMPAGRKIGITCALLKGDLPGITRGRRHMPMHVPFINSPLWGKDVIIDVEDDVIGGESGLGEGWRMLMECLSVGRGISLPAVSGFASKFTTRITLMYASIRKQFGMPVAKFEAIEEVLARMIANTYTSEAIRIFTASAVKNGHKPAITNAIAKYHNTEISRKVVNDAMDVLGGAAICVGPNNLIAHAYMGLPVGITVEGANIMTRALLQFGQGLMRCHPFLYNEMTSIQANDLKMFDINFWCHVGSFFAKRARIFTLKIKSILCMPFCFSIEKKYSLKIERISARFGFFADLILLIYGGNFKIKEKLSGRFADVVSHLYIMSSTLRKFKASNFSKEEEPIVIYALEQSLQVIDKAMLEIYANLSNSRIVSKTIKMLFLLCPPMRESGIIKDKITYKIVHNVSTDKSLFENLFDNIFVSKNPSDRLNMLERNFKDITKAVEIIKKVKRSKVNYNTALQSNIITNEEFEFITKWEEVAEKIIQVDHFPL